jgi:hypothetical protein
VGGDRHRSRRPAVAVRPPQARRAEHRRAGRTHGSRRTRRPASLRAEPERKRLARPRGARGRRAAARQAVLAVQTGHRPR